MKKGFTLIELLAVIVILAIIALIATPIVINIINEAKKESMKRSIDLYMNTVHKRITQENMKVKYDPDRCDIQENGNVKCYVGDEVIKTSTGEKELKIEMNGKKPESGTISFKTSNTEGNNTNNNKITYSGVVLEGIEYELQFDGKTNSKPAPEKATGEDYRGYYADVDGDGDVDGIIYADLNKSSEAGAKWTNSDGKYSYTKKENLNEYTVSKEKYKENEGFGENKIIKLKKDKGSSRFYVMALLDFRTGSFQKGNNQCYNDGYIDCTLGTYYWYKNAYGKMNASDTKQDFGEGYNNTGKIIEIWNKNGSGEGSYVGATQYNYDIWKHIQEEYAKGWYIPSSGEWSAFANYFLSKGATLLTSDYDSNWNKIDGNYDDVYKLSKVYWSSSRGASEYVCHADFSNGGIGMSSVSSYHYYVRLGTTF